MTANELHDHQSFEEQFLWVCLMVLFAISFHSLAWISPEVLRFSLCDKRIAMERVRLG